MESSELLSFVLEKIDDMKARDVTKFDVSEKSSLTDHMVICSGNSKRHVQSIAENVVQEAKKAEIEILGVEGLTVGEWVLVDLGDVVLHAMQESTRDFYQLEKLWGE